MSGGRASNKDIYEQVLPDGSIAGRIDEHDLRRFADVASRVLPDCASLLDVGCCSGHWLHYVLSRRPIKRHLGIDVAENRIAEAKRLFPELNVRTGFAEELDLPEKGFDTVTCFEVLEHVEDWEAIFRSLFRFAGKQVLVTVPYREQITYTVCIHCAKPTPMWGHLRSYTEESFPLVPGWERTFGKIRNRSPRRSLSRRIYYFLRRRYSWLLVDYRRSG